MAGVNKVILVGRLGKDPEVRYTADGTAIASFSVATSREWKDKATGDKKERTDWHRVVAWRKLGEICGEYLSKGKQVYIEGSLQTREWADQQGNKRWTTEIVANDMQMLGSRGEVESFSGGNSEPSPEPTGGPTENDIPF